MTEHVKYEVIGDGPPVLFLHGLGMGKQVWGPIVQQLQAHYQCITLDFLGAGENKAPEGLECIPLDSWIEDIRDVIQTFNLKKFHLVGHSLGSFIALAFVATFPSNCLSVTAISALPEFDPVITNAFEERAKKVEKLGVDGIVNDLVKGGFSEKTLNNKVHTVEEFRKIVSRNTAPQYALSCRSVANLSIHHLLKKITTPAQLIVGLDDKVTPPLLSETICESLIDCKIYTLEDCGHYIHIEKSEDVSNLIFNFINQKH